MIVYSPNGYHHTRHAATKPRFAQQQAERDYERVPPREEPVRRRGRKRRGKQ